MLNRSPAKVVSSAAVENLEPRRLNSATSLDIGLNMNDGASATVAKVVPTLKALGVKSLRLWTSVTDFNDRTMTGVMQRAIDYSNAGFDITLEVANKGGFVPDADSVKGWFAWASSNTALKAAVDRWEIGNEPDHTEYWQGSLSQYVNQYLKPASEALHAAGETVVSAGPSWNVNDVATMIDAGMLNYTDYVGFHPYATGVGGVATSVAKINALVAGRKPIAFTEWNVRGLEGNKAAWAAAVAAAYPAIVAGSDLNYYFAMRVQNSMAGPGGIFTTSYGLNQPFYNAFATFAAVTGSIPTTTPSTGNTSSGSGKISGTLFNDDDADGTFDSNEKATGSRVVYIDANKNGKLDAGEKSTTSASNGTYSFTGLTAGTYNISRVYPNGYKMSNNTAGYIPVTITVGQSLSGVAVGTTLKSTVLVGTDSSSGSTGNDTAAGTASISGTLFNDTDKDGVKDSNEVATGSRTVFLDTDKDGKLDAGEKSTTSNSNGYYSFTGLVAGTYNVTRLFPVGYKLSNNSLGYVATTVAAAAAKSGVNLGTKAA